MDFVPLLGRILFSVIFLMSGVGHFFQYRGIVNYATAKGAPTPEIMVPVTGLMMLVGGLSVLLGFKARWGALLLLLFLLPAAFLIHNFWTIADPAMSQGEQAHFFKNVALAGASLLIMYFGSGPYSLDTSTAAAARASTSKW
jgi:putative oxidoreductase